VENSAREESVHGMAQGDVVEFSIRQGQKGPWAYGVSRVR